MKRNYRIGVTTLALTLYSFGCNAAADAGRFETGADALDRGSDVLLRGVLDEAPELITDPDSNFSADKYKGYDFANHAEKILKPINDDELYEHWMAQISQDTEYLAGLKDNLANDEDWKGELLAGLDSGSPVGCNTVETKQFSAHFIPTAYNDRGESACKAALRQKAITSSSGYVSDAQVKTVTVPTSFQSNHRGCSESQFGASGYSGEWKNGRWRLTIPQGTRCRTISQEHGNPFEGLVNHDILNFTGITCYGRVAITSQQ